MNGMEHPGRTPELEADALGRLPDFAGVPIRVLVYAVESYWHKLKRRCQSARELWVPPPKRSGIPVRPPHHEGRE